MLLSSHQHWSPGLTHANTSGCTFSLAVNSNVTLTRLKLNIIVLSTGIMGKVGRSAFHEVIIELVRMKCLPVILYGTDACPLAKQTFHQWTVHLAKYLFLNNKKLLMNTGRPLVWIISIKLLKSSTQIHCKTSCLRQHYL